MAVKLSSLKADTKAETDGEWKDVPDVPGLGLFVRSIHYPPFVTARAEVARQLAARYGNDKIPDDEVQASNAQIIVNHLLLDWRGLAEDDGSPALFTKARAIELLSDPGYREVLGHVLWAAGRVGARRLEFIVDAEKNSEKPSAGT